MMKFYHYSLRALAYTFLLLAGSALLASCANDEMVFSSQGGLRITLNDEMLDVTHTRATPAEIGKPVAGLFRLTVESTSTGNLAYDGMYTDETINLTADTYRVTATCGELQELAIDSPYYLGLTTVEVKDRETTAAIACRVANSLLSVRFSNPDLFAQLYVIYGLEVNTGNRSLILGNGNSTQSAYFFPDNSDLRIAFKATTHEGQSISQDLTDKLKEMLQADFPLQAGHHAIVSIGVSNTGFDITTSVTMETINQSIPLQWLPKPKVAGFGNITYTETEDAPSTAVIAYNASSSIQDMELSLNFQDEQFSDFNKTYRLSSLTGEERDALATTLGIILPAIGEATEGSINLQPLLSRLQTNAGNTTSNTFSLRVKANNRWSDESVPAENYTVTVEKPEFSVSVYPGNIWTKEFTANALMKNQVTKGSFSELSKKMTYQFSTDGVNWATIENGGLTQQNLTPGQKYYVRSLYRNSVASNNICVFNLGEQIEIPYGDMENWTPFSRELMPGANFFKKVTITGHYPDNNIWTCVNKKTFEGSPNVASTYNLNPSTYQETGRNGSGYAAALRTVGWDNNAGNTTSIIYHVSAGKLFIGNYDFAHKNGPENYNYGMDYNSRPTSLASFYKYFPYNNDSFKAWIVLENRDNAEVKRIGYGEFTSNKSASDFTEMSIPITYDSQYQEYSITHMYVVFSSSAACAEDESTESSNLKGMVSGGDYHNGSVLIIDDITINYEK